MINRLEHLLHVVFRKMCPKDFGIFFVPTLTKLCLEFSPFLCDIKTEYVMNMISMKNLKHLELTGTSVKVPCQGVRVLNLPESLELLKLNRISVFVEEESQYPELKELHLTNMQWEPLGYPFILQYHNHIGTLTSGSTKLKKICLTWVDFLRPIYWFSGPVDYVRVPCEILHTLFMIGIQK